MVVELDDAQTRQVGEPSIVRQEDTAATRQGGGELKGIRCARAVHRPELRGSAQQRSVEIHHRQADAPRQQRLIALGRNSVARSTRE